MQIVGEGDRLLYLNLSHSKEQMQILAEAIATRDGRKLLDENADLIEGLRHLQYCVGVGGARGGIGKASSA